MRALVINCSAPHYNLGARKLYDWLQSRDYTVTYHDGDPGMVEVVSIGTQDTMQLLLLQNEQVIEALATHAV